MGRDRRGGGRGGGGGGRGGGGGGFRGPPNGGGGFRGGGPGGRGGGGPPPAGPPRPPLVDRTKTCPLLLRVFVKQGAHHRIEDFAKPGQVRRGGGARTRTPAAAAAAARVFAGVRWRQRALLCSALCAAPDNGNNTPTTRHQPTNQPTTTNNKHRAKEPDGGVHVYTWVDATLGELTELVQEVRG